MKCFQSLREEPNVRWGDIHRKWAQKKRVGFKHALKTEMTLQADSLAYAKMQKQKYTYFKKDGQKADDFECKGTEV